MSDTSPAEIVRTAPRRSGSAWMIVLVALAGAWASGSLLVQHGGDWRIDDSSPSYLLRSCGGLTVSIADCAGVVDSRWGSFDFYVGSRRILMPTSLLGLMYFSAIAVWFAMVGVPPVGARLLWATILSLLTLGLASSLWFLGLMLFVLPSWCPLCCMAHLANAVAFALVLWLRRLAVARSSVWERSDRIDTVHVLSRRHLLSATATCGFVAAVCWLHFDTSMALKERWLKLAEMNRVIATMRGDSDMMRREFDAERIRPMAISSAARMSVVESRPGPARLLVFSNFDQSASACFEKGQLAHIADVYGDEITVEFRYLPVAANASSEPTDSDGRVTESDWLASYAAEAARGQGGRQAFQHMRELLFATRNEGAGRSYRALAKQVGLEVDRFLKDMTDPLVRERVREDVALAAKLGVRSAPAVFLDGRRVPDLCMTSDAFWYEVAADYIRNLGPVASGVNDG